MYFTHCKLFFEPTQPKIVEALLGYELVQVSCGASHVLAVTNEREVFAWGRGDNGKLQYSFYSPLPYNHTRSSLAICLDFAVQWLIYAAASQSSVFIVGCLLMFWKVAWGWAPKTPTTLRSRCVYPGNLRPRESCAASTAPWSSARTSRF